NHEFPFFTLAKGEKNCYSNKVKIIEKVSSCDGKIEALCADPLSDSSRRLCHFHDGGCIHYPVLIDFVPGPENIRAFLLSFLNVHWGIDKSTHRVYNKNTPHGGIVLRGDLNERKIRCNRHDLFGLLGTCRKERPGPF